jgi:hypothetical protein
MSDVNLRYRSNVAVDALELGECTVRKTRLAVATWWELWLFVPRDDCDDSEMVAVPVNVNGTFTEKGPGGRTWGLKKLGRGLWQVSPSINVVADAQACKTHPGPHPSLPSVWHHTPALVNVPEGESWQA